MKKRVFILFLAICLLCSGCQKKKESAKPEITQARFICELATVECYYHNVAKYKEEDASGILFWKKDKIFWIEYAGIVKLGIDADLVDITVDGNNVTITMPPAKVLSCKVDENSLTDESYIVAKKSAKVTAEDEREAFEAAQANMEKQAAEDRDLLNSAQERAKKLLEDYVNNIGDSVGKEYTIKWVYVDDPSIETTTEKAVEETEK